MGKEAMWVRCLGGGGVDGSMKGALSFLAGGWIVRVGMDIWHVDRV